MHLIMRTETFAKLFFMVSFSGLLMYTALAFYSFHTAYTTVYDFETYHTPGMPKPGPYEKSMQTDNQLKYILIWTTPEFTHKILDIGLGQGPFVKNNCSFDNCYISIEKNLLKAYHTDFDVVFVDIAVLRRSLWKSLMPYHRSERQKYLFHSMRSAEETPLCNLKVDNYFNWTWSYKIFSDISTPFIEVRDKDGHFVAPKIDVKWIENMSAVTEKDIEKLKTKKRAVAWIPESCKLNRFGFVKELAAALKVHSLDLDILGCQMGNCPKEGCMKALERDYYFYLAYEPSHAEDYVTEEVLKAYHHNTVPIVKGGADYRYFLPEGSYINAGSGTVEKLATLIDYSIKTPSVYHSFHQWKYHYSIKKGDHKRGLCDLCAMMNNKQRVITSSSYEKFRKWWYSGLEDRCYPKGAENADFVISYLNESRHLNMTDRNHTRNSY